MGLAKKFVFGGRGRKGNVKRVTRRNLLPLKPARSLKGNVKGGSRQNSLPFRRGAEEKGSVKRGKRQNPLPPRQLLRRQPPYIPKPPINSPNHSSRNEKNMLS